MTTVVGTDYVDTANSTVHTFTVPAGVTTSMVALFLCGTNSGLVNPITWSTSGAGTFTAIDAQVCTNCYVTIAKGSGFVPGDTITATTGTPQNVTIGHYYDDTIAAYGTPAATVATVTQTAQTSGSLTPAVGQRVRVIQVNRSVAAITVASVTSSGGETVSTLDYQDNVTGATVNTLFAEYTATAATAHTATVTMSSMTNHNTYIAQIPITAAATQGLGLPNGMKVEVEFVAGTWTDVTADVDAQTGISLKFGRTSEFSAPQSATCDLTLDDSAGKYTALNAASPYYPNIRPRRRIRVSSTYGPRFVGYIKGWPPGFDGNRRIVHITAADRMGLLARKTLRNTVDDAIMADQPSWYFPMNDSGSNTSGGLWLAEYSAQQAPAPYWYLGSPTTGGVAGGYGPPTGVWDTPWVNFTPALVGPTPVSGWAGLLSNGGPVAAFNATNFSLCLAYKLAIGDPLGNDGGIAFQQCVNNNPWVSLTVGIIGTGWWLYCPSSHSGGVTYMGGALPSVDNKPHVLHVTGNSLGAIDVFIDGEIQASAGDSPILTSAGTTTLVGASAPPYGSVTPWYGALAHLAMWNGTVLTFDQVTDQANAILTGYSGEMSGATAARILALSGVAGTDMNIATGQAVMGSYPQAGKTVDTALADIATTEGGGAVCYVDTDGRVRFNDRTYRNATIPAMTIDAVLDLDGSTFTPAYDELTLVNNSNVTNNTTGNVLTYTDTASVAEFQRTTDQATSYARDDLAALNLAQDRVSRQSEPALRIPQLAVDLFTATGTATYSALANITIGSRLRVVNLPTTVTGATGSVVCFPLGQLDACVEGWSETIAIDTYQVVFDVSPADNPPRMLWDDATYGRWQADPGSMILNFAITNTSTTAQVATSGGSPVLTTSAGDLPFLMVIDTEVVKVTAVSGSSSPQNLTIVRAQNGTLATAHASNTPMSVYPTAAWTL